MLRRRGAGRLCPRPGAAVQRVAGAAERAGIDAADNDCHGVARAPQFGAIAPAEHAGRDAAGNDGHGVAVAPGPIPPPRWRGGEERAARGRRKR